jgi:hypothetical protein
MRCVCFYLRAERRSAEWLVQSFPVIVGPVLIHDAIGRVQAGGQESLDSFVELFSRLCSGMCYLFLQRLAACITGGSTFLVE